MQQYLYLLIDFACIVIPFLFSFHPKLQFHKEWRHFFPAMIAVGMFFLIWDEIFTANGFWGFDSRYITGIKLGHLPLEEILFFVCIPYACVFTYHCFKKLLPKQPAKQLGNFFGFFLLGFSITLAIKYSDRWYTVLTFTFLALTLLFTKLTNNWKHLAMIVIGYVVILPFFFLSNGILTGSFIPDQIVWYNDAENIGKRIFTIPFEDGFYGFLLIFMNVELFEWLRGRKPSKD